MRTEEQVLADIQFVEADIKELVKMGASTSIAHDDLDERQRELREVRGAATTTPEQTQGGSR